MTRFCSQALVGLGIITQRLRNLRVQNYHLQLLFADSITCRSYFAPIKDTLADPTFRSDDVNRCVRRYGYISIDIPNPSVSMVEALGIAPRSSITSNIYNTIYYITLFIKSKVLIMVSLRLNQVDSQTCLISRQCFYQEIY